MGRGLQDPQERWGKRVEAKSCGGHRAQARHTSPTERCAVPAKSQLLRVSPFRPRGGVRDELAPVAGLLDKHSVEIAWGVPFSPTQFVAEALRVGHPQNLDLVLPGALACVAKKLAAEHLASIAKMRVECIRHWTARARELAPAEK